MWLTVNQSKRCHHGARIVWCIKIYVSETFRPVIGNAVTFFLIHIYLCCLVWQFDLRFVNLRHLKLATCDIFKSGLMMLLCQSSCKTHPILNEQLTVIDPIQGWLNVWLNPQQIYLVSRPLNQEISALGNTKSRPSLSTSFLQEFKPCAFSAELSQ